MKKLFLLALISFMFVSCVDKKEQTTIQEEEILIETDSTSVEVDTLETDSEESEVIE